MCGKLFRFVKEGLTNIILYFQSNSLLANMRMRGLGTSHFSWTDQKPKKCRYVLKIKIRILCVTIMMSLIEAQEVSLFPIHMVISFSPSFSSIVIQLRTKPHMYVQNSSGMLTAQTFIVLHK